MTPSAHSAAIQVVPFSIGDQSGVLDLILPIQQQEFSVPVTAADQPDLLAIPTFYQTGAGGFWVAKVNGAVVGSIALKDIGDQQVALRKMFVAAPFRGAGYGTAQALLASALAAAGANGVKAIFLGTTDKFLAAHRFYEKNGFIALPKTALPPSFPIMAVDSKFYTLSLDPR